MTLKRQLREKIQYITPNGTTYTLHDPPRRAVIRTEGLGMPSIELKRISGPYQHGERAIAGLLMPRTVTLTYRQSGCSRDEYWDAREQLIDLLRMNLTSDPDLYSMVNDPEPGELRFTYYIGGIKTVRSIDVYLINGFSMPPGQGWDEFAIQDTLEFIAVNPVFYNPTQHSQVLVVGNNTINYLGNWEEYPTIVVDGTVQNFGVLNLETNYYILMNYTSPIGDTMTFDLSWGLKKVTNQIGANLLNYLTPGTQLLNFSLQPDPVVANGQNTLQVSLAAGAPTMTLYWYDRYVGI